MGSKSFADKNVADSSKTDTRKANITQVFFGDTHLHTNYSFDAYLNLNYSADPDTAYRWAKGQPVIHPYNRARVKINTPLDFLVVSDHAEMLGVMRAVREETAVFEDQGAYQNLKRWFSVRLMNRAIDKDQGLEFFSRFYRRLKRLTSITQTQ